jgi:hypothetical protein
MILGKLKESTREQHTNLESVLDIKMEITRTAKPGKKMADLKVWFCEGCAAVHMSIGEAVINFDREEFSKFTESIVDINYTGWTPAWNEHSILDLASRDGAAGTVH